MEETYRDREFSRDEVSNEPLAKGEYDHCTFINCELTGADLSGYLFDSCTFTGCNLSMVKLNKTTLRDVTFEGCKMLGVHFYHCNKFGLSFSFDRCVLDHSSFYQMVVKGTKFIHTQMRETDLTACDMTGALFEGCDMTGATFDHTTLEKADMRTAYGYIIDPESNKIRKAKFSLTGVTGLLRQYDIEIEGL